MSTDDEIRENIERLKQTMEDAKRLKEELGEKIKELNVLLAKSKRSAASRKKLKGWNCTTTGTGQPQTEVRYSPAAYEGPKKTRVMGNPVKRLISTSHIERQNLTIRMSNRRFTWLTNAFSKKLENHKHAAAIHFMHYNFCRIHQTFACDPAMEAGVANHVWTIEEIVALLETDWEAFVTGREIENGKCRKIMVAIHRVTRLSKRARALVKESESILLQSRSFNSRNRPRK
jgi:hypothetical protein